MYLHWTSLRLQCQVAFWLTRQFQWNSYSKWQCKFQVAVPVIAMFFPTCQVRVVRFYQSCSSASSSSFSSSASSSPPPPVSPRPCLHQLPRPLPPCQLVANLFANFRTQWALLDLNCKGLSALGTAGPQPGTFRAQ